MGPGDHDLLHVTVSARVLVLRIILFQTRSPEQSLSAPHPGEEAAPVRGRPAPHEPGASASFLTAGLGRGTLPSRRLTAAGDAAENKALGPQL